MNKILILFGHPQMEKSRIHNELVRQVQSMDGVRFHDIYEAYPDFDIDIDTEQELLLQHDIIILQHPMYWYSAPPLFKQWLDLVLQYGWAYGPNGRALAGKYVLQSISTGGPKEAYGHEGRNRFSIREFLAPFEQSFRLCQMQYLPPFIVHGTHWLTSDDIARVGTEYACLVEWLRDHFEEGAFQGLDILGPAFPGPHHKNVSDGK